ncbi:helix-turn-helix domain-containing protein [Hominibacterium faecale]|uniref:Helix-turn-helix domain-containing protein n=1 Tax=Hominibacterium faecale TaxID=2839743 RepID=A0A9J6QZH5_9FIRM|nr:helix-turn-helix transcriptional regulator [Hominibacterium faecale]MCU7380934.1 helix-turn-helix domain-containing protein [Hominibacterium faecale]
MTLQSNLSNVINAIRKTRGLTITEFSEELGISRSAMQTLLNGKCNPRMDTLEQISDRLNVDPSILISSNFSEEEWKLIFLFFNGIDAFCQLSEEDKRNAATLICELLHVFMKK